MKAAISHAILVLCIIFHGSIAAKIEALFSPTDKPTKRLIELINAAKKSIHAAVYLLTDKTVADALVQAKQKNAKLDITLVLDQVSTDFRYGKADYLVQNNIPVFIFDPKKNQSHRGLSNDKWSFDNPIMHNKFALIDGVTLWTGSFNWTVSACIHNRENVLITDNREMCKRYESNFTTLLKNECYRHTVEKQKTYKQSSLHHDIQTALESSSNNDEILLEKIFAILGKFVSTTNTHIAQGSNVVPSNLDLAKA